MQTVPIILFTYKRLDSLQKSIASLAACTLASSSDLVVFSDAPGKEEDREKVAAVRQFLSTVQSFKSVRVIAREQNLGVDFNIINGLQQAAKEFDKFIVLEDDLVFSPNFLQFMNQALTQYEQHADVLSVSGFSFVSKIPENYPFDIYFTRRSWSWGWGTWSSKISQADWSVKDFDTFIQDRSLQKAFNEAGGSDLTKMLRETMQGKIRAWDIRLFYHQFKHQLKTAYPVSSKVVNIGFTPEGHNTFGYNRYKTTLDTSNKQSFNLPADSAIEPALNAAFLAKNNLFNRIKTRLFSMAGIK